MSNKYPINTLREMMAIPEDRFEAFLAEMPGQLREVRKVLDASNVLAKFAGGEIDIGGVEWNDDGKTDTNIVISVKKPAES